jgi:uncharacterized hydrophobic protein (TIGR00271 family)
VSSCERGEIAEAGSVIALEIFGRSPEMTRVAGQLDGVDGVSRVRIVAATRAGHSVVSAAVRPRSLDNLLEKLHGLGVADSSLTLTRLDIVGRAATGQVEPSLVWEDVLGMAWLYSRPIARYVAFMVVAGVIAGYGVIDKNQILIVGAMAVSPDLLPIAAVAVGVVGRRAGLAGRALATLLLGLGVASVAAASCTFAQDQLDLLPSGFDLQEVGILGSLVSVNDETIVVALVAGIAGMLALETRASSGVGVAISVTTIPAAAYLGVAAGLGELEEAWGAVGVLAVNVVMLVVGSSVTLALQRVLMSRAVARRRPSPR